MSLLFCDSFDHYNTAGLTLKYSAAPGGATISASLPRTGIQCLVISGAFGPTIAVNNLPSLVFGTALRPNVFDVNFVGDFVKFMDGGTAQIRVGLSPTGAIVIRRGNDPFSTTLATSAVVLPTNSYSYLEVAVTISNGAGSVEVRLNEISVLTFNGDTQASGNAFATGVQLMSLGGAGNWRHDDVYLLNAAISPNQTFLGAVEIEALMPNADDSPLQWTPSSGVTHFNLVDEVPQDTTDYVSSNTVGQVDNYLYPTGVITPPVVVFGVQHTMFAALDAAGAHEIASNVDGVAGPSVSLTTSFRFYPTPYDQKAGVDWNLASIATTGFGPELTS